jgi:hypothetical protein
MPCCRSSNEKPTASVPATPPEEVKAADDKEAAPKTASAEEKSETKKRGCGCQC